MARVLILEGARGVGKSTLAQKIRQLTKSSTLVNPTGFEERGMKGLKKIMKYYDSWSDLITSLKGEDMLFIFDRYFFSEEVFSKLYKDYSFTNYYNKLLSHLFMGADKVDIVFLECYDPRVILDRLDRDKASFMSSDSYDEFVKVQRGYDDLFVKLRVKLAEINYHKVDLDFEEVDSQTTVEELATTLIKRYNLKTT